MTASDTPPPLTDEELQTIRALWADIRTARTEKTSIGEMVPVDIDLFDAKLPKVFAEVDRLKDQRSHARRRHHQLRQELDEAHGEVAFHHTWDGLMALVEQHYPENIFPTVAGPDQRDPGPRIVSLVRWVDQLRTQLYNSQQCAVRELEAQVRGDEAEAETDRIRAERDALAAKLAAVERLRYDDTDDGNPYEHIPGYCGAGCSGCWAENIGRALGETGGTDAR